MKAAAKSEFPEGKGKKVVINGKNIAVFNIDGKFYATDHKCTHMGGPLSDGTLENFCVNCPWHHSVFDLNSGEVKKGPAKKSISVYKTKIEGDDLLIEV